MDQATHNKIGSFTAFAKVSTALEKRLADWGSDEDEGDDEEGGAAKKGLPEKKRSADILAIEKEAEGLLDGLLKSGAQP